jgi:predicted  nucleic acid-binding Zn-ribbon protein
MTEKERNNVLSALKEHGDKARIRKEFNLSAKELSAILKGNMHYPEVWKYITDLAIARGVVNEDLTLNHTKGVVKLRPLSPADIRKIESLENRIKELEGELKVVTDINKEYEEKMKNNDAVDNNAELEDLAGEIAELKVKLKSEQSMKSSARSEAKKLKEQIKKLEEEMEKERTGFRFEIDQLEHSLSNAKLRHPDRDEVKNLKDIIKGLKESLAQERLKCAELEGQISSLKSESFVGIPDDVVRDLIAINDSKIANRLLMHYKRALDR